ncbi:MAG: substrate-binding domain-containing protein [Anaerolineales bacterium]
MKYKNGAKRPTIGVLAGWEVFAGTIDSFLGRVFRGIQAAAQDQDCNLLLACGIIPGKPAWPMVSPEVDFVPVGPWNTDGLIIASPYNFETGEQYARDLIASGFPVIYAGDRDTGPTVVVDNAGGIRQAIQHLAKHGHHRIAFVSGERNSEHGDSSMRLRAFKEEIQSINPSFDSNLIASGLNTYEGGRQAIQQILDRRIPFTAVIASNDPSAIGALDGLQQAGFVVPQDIALVGFDDRLEARSLVPPLTTVHYPMFTLGYQAVELLLRMIDGESLNNNHIEMIPANLVIRDSCGCLPGSRSYMEPFALTTESQQDLTSEQVSSQLTEQISAAVHKGSLWLSQEEISYLVTSLVEAFMLTLERNDSSEFFLVIKQILERVSFRGYDLFPWQNAITILRNQLPLIEKVVVTQVTREQEEDILHQGRIAISEVAYGQFTRSLIDQIDQADRVGLMTSKFFAANSEEEIFSVLTENLPAIGIRNVVVGYYERKDNDPVNWSVLQRLPSVIGGVKDERRILSREFPLAEDYSLQDGYQLALLPLNVRDDLCGFVAFDAGNLDPCADIVRQLGAALSNVQLYQKAVDAQKIAEEANRLKSRFLSMVSHELRTPLNLITGISNLLLDEYKNDDERHHKADLNSIEADLERIYISAQHLDGLIRDVVDLASSDIGQLKLSCEPLDITEVLSAVDAIGQQLAADKGITWQFEMQKDLPLVWGDRTRLRQVALNLVNNAVKFTSYGEIALTALVENGNVVVSVSDTGLGIPSREQKVIFDEFRQSERSTARGYGGLGLGLAICRKLVEMHGGEINVCSSGDEGEGSMFYFSLPIFEQPQDFSEKILPVSDAFRVLLLVKHARGNSRLKEKLVEQGYEVELCFVEENDDWLTALVLAEPDTVLLDLGLTSERGWEILRMLKENPATKDIPVLFYNDNQGADGASMLQIDYLTKPVDVNTLNALLASQGFFHPDSINNGHKPILVVDDDPEMLAFHTRILEKQLPNYPVSAVDNARKALQLIDQQLPALIMLDLMMPDMDGFEFLDELQKNEETRSIPVVVVTGQVLNEQEMIRLNSGVVSIISKGIFNVDEIFEHLNNALERKQKMDSKSQRIVLKSLAFIHEHYPDSISRKDIAGYVGLSERHLTRCFHQEVGVTPITYLNRYRVMQAKRMLDTNHKGITEIALEVGFSSHSYFSRVFREQVGVTPRAYLQSRCGQS